MNFRLPAVAAALLLSFAAEAKPLGERVRTRIAGVSDVRVNLTGAQFTVLTDLTRKNFPPMVLTGIEYDVLVGERRIGHAAIDENHRLKRSQAVRVEIPTQLSPSAGLMAMMAGGSSTELTITGTVTGRWLFFTQERTFTRTIAVSEITDALNR